MNRHPQNILILAGILLVTVSCAKTAQKSVATQEPSVKVSSLEVPNRVVHFNFDSDEILASDTEMLVKNAEWMKRNKDVVVILEGHCDEAGASTYNMELGDRRARSIKASLIEAGIPYDRIIMVVSYGDTKPVDPGKTIEAMRRNRRVEFIVR